MLRITKMNNRNKNKSLPFRGALLSSWVMAFAGLGDAFLYPVLPVYGKEMGFSVFAIGLLLSVNRFVRILTNTQMANLVHKVGRKNMLIVAATIAIFSTYLYGIKIGVIIFFLARVLWGLCYSGLKIATLSYAAQEKKKSGLAFGLAQGIKNLGGLSVLWFGPMLIEEYGIKIGFYTIAMISVIGVILALFLPPLNLNQNEEKVKTKTTFYPSAMNILVFMLSTTIDGILVVALAQILTPSYTEITTLLTVVAFYILLKKLFASGMSMLSGFLTLKIDPYKFYIISVSVTILALVLIAFSWVVFGIILAFLSNAITVTYSPLMAIRNQLKKNNTLQAISGISTWWDLGAALGAFIGISLVEFFGVMHLFLVLAFIILILFINFTKQYNSTST